MEVKQVNSESIVNETVQIKHEGYRFVTMTCVELDADKVDIYYHFDKDLSMLHLKITVSKDEPVISISHVYFAALLIENEIYDQFGIKFSGLILDYGRTFYMEEEVKSRPFCRFSVVKEENIEPKEDNK